MLQSENLSSAQSAQHFEERNVVTVHALSTTIKSKQSSHKKVIMACCFVGACLAQTLCRFSSFVRALCVLEHQQSVYCITGEILPCLKKNILKIGPSSQKLSTYWVTGPVLELVQQLNKTHFGYWKVYLEKILTWSPLTYWVFKCTIS